MKLSVPLSFDWDKGNKEKNWKKHGVDLKECEQAFFDSQIKFFEDPGHSTIENRFLAYGQTEKERKLVLVFTIRKQKIRIISARDQNKKERRVYEIKENS
jgi:uncharacterized protein